MIAFLVDQAIRALLLAVVPLLALALLWRAPEKIKRQILGMILGVSMATPFATLTLPTVTLRVPADVLPGVIRVHVPEQITPTPFVSTSAAEAVGPGAAASVPATSSARVPAIDLVATLYVGGVAVLLLRLVVGVAGTRRWMRRGRTAIDAVEMQRVLRRMAFRVGPKPPRLPRVGEHPDIAVPITTGIVRPAIWLPAAWREWDGPTLEAILAHELAHIAHRDAAAQRLSLIYRAVFWFSPFSWWLHGALVASGERASDEAVLDAGADRVQYAELLLRFFRVRSRCPAAGVAMASGRTAAKRIKRILAWDPRPARRSRVIVAVLAALISVAVPIAARITPIPQFADSNEVSSPATREPAHVFPPPPPPSSRVPPSRRVQGEASPIAGQQSATNPSSLQTLESSLRRLALLDEALRPPAAGHRMVAMVFDLRALQAAERRFAVALARRQVVASISAPDVASVSVIGDHPQLPLPFTSVQASLNGSLDAVTGAETATTLPGTSLADICTLMSSLQQAAIARAEAGLISPEAVPRRLVIAYFGSTRSDVTLERSVAYALCRRADVQLVHMNVDRMMIAGPSETVQYLRTVSRTLQPAAAGFGFTVARQSESPVQIWSTRHTMDHGYAEVTLRNESSKAIRGLRLGVVVTMSDSRMAPQVIFAPWPGLALRPGETMAIQSRILDGAEVDRWARIGGTSEVGVVEVEFADGTRWTYDLKAKGAFGK